MQASHTRTRMPVTALTDPKIIVPAIGVAFAKLDPRTLIKNPVMFVVEMVAALTTVLFIRDVMTGASDLGFSFQIILWLWFTILFANFAEAVAEGRGKAQAATLRQTREETKAKLIVDEKTGFAVQRLPRSSPRGRSCWWRPAIIIPSDGEVIEGVASVNEAAVTGESAPVIREAGGDRSAVTGGTLVVSDWIKVRITAAAGATFLDRMIKLVEGAERQKTPNEIALTVLLAGLTLIFLIAVATIPSFRELCRRQHPDRGACRAVRRAHPDHDRRAVVGHRHRRNGSPGAFQRARHVRPGGRGRRRRRHARFSTRPARSRSAIARPTEFIPLKRRYRSARSPMRPSSRRSPTRRRKAARSSSWPRRNTASAAATSARAHGANSSRSPRRAG